MYWAMEWKESSDNSIGQDLILASCFIDQPIRALERYFTTYIQLSITTTSVNILLNNCLGQTCVSGEKQSLCPLILNYFHW